MVQQKSHYCLFKENITAAEKCFNRDILNDNASFVLKVEVISWN